MHYFFSLIISYTGTLIILHDIMLSYIIDNIPVGRYDKQELQMPWWTGDKTTENQGYAILGKFLEAH